jgi:hypothetical protein
MIAISIIIFIIIVVLYNCLDTPSDYDYANDSFKRIL